MGVLKQAITRDVPAKRLYLPITAPHFPANPDPFILFVSFVDSFIWFTEFQFVLTVQSERVRM